MSRESRLARELLEELRRTMGGWDVFTENTPKLKATTVTDWRIFCGDGRYDSRRRNAAFHGGVALNYQIHGQGETVVAYEIGVFWPSGWALMYHDDEARMSWPRHPRHHIQFSESASLLACPFANWRIPFGFTEPRKIIEHLVDAICYSVQP